MRPLFLYHFRIAYIFVDVSLAFVMVALFQFTDPIASDSIKNKSVTENIESFSKPSNIYILYYISKYYSLY